MIQAAPVTSYSSLVQLKLLADGQEFELADIGPDAVSLRESASLPPCIGEVSMTVDGRERIWNVSLPEGVIAPNRLVAIQRL
ncbi:MAG: hypothetical protein AABP62_29450 [Planctomycetota bacterium]